jgi:hypothetical protein
MFAPYKQHCLQYLAIQLHLRDRRDCRELSWITLQLPLLKGKQLSPPGSIETKTDIAVADHRCPG